LPKNFLYILTTTIGEKWQIYIQKKQNLKSLLLEWLRTKIKDMIIKEYSELQNQFPDVQDSVVAVYPSGDKNVIVEFVSKGTLPDQSKFELPICTIFTIENGKITKIIRILIILNNN
jgi:hypothetical protein